MWSVSRATNNPRSACVQKLHVEGDTPSKNGTPRGASAIGANATGGRVNPRIVSHALAASAYDVMSRPSAGRTGRRWWRNGPAVYGDRNGPVHTPDWAVLIDGGSAIGRTRPARIGAL